jgi:hypothetical protein
MDLSEYRRSNPNWEYFIGALQVGGQTSASGGVTLPTISLGGTAALDFTGSGGVTLPAPALHGTDKELFVGTGALTITAPTLAGTATNMPLAPPIPPATGGVGVWWNTMQIVPGPPRQKVTGSGALSVQTVRISGRAHVADPVLAAPPLAIFGTGALHMTVRVHATASMRFAGAGMVILPAVSLAGAARRDLTPILEREDEELMMLLTLQ